MLDRVSPYIGIYRKAYDVRLPEVQTRGSACFDLAAYIKPGNIIKGYDSVNIPYDTHLYDNKLTIHPGHRVLVPTGLIFDIPTGYSVRIHNRSSLPLKTGLVLANAEGVIDSDYVEEIFVMLQNTSETSVTINDGDRIAQAELTQSIPQILYEIADRPTQKTDRTGGFGSTGVNSNVVNSIASQI